MSTTVSPLPEPQSGLLRDQVTDLVREAILQLRLKPGQRLIDTELMKWTGVSRATIRETIRQLAGEGLVDVLPRRGAVVARPSLKDVLAIYELRAAIEGFATSLFTAKASDDQVAQLRATVDDFEQLAQAGAGSAEIVQAKNRYYDLLFEGAGNPVLKEIEDRLLGRVNFARFGRSSGTWALGVVDELREILAAVEARDAEKAERLAAAHVENSSQGASSCLFLRRDDEDTE